jgi:hypothetical protein
MIIKWLLVLVGLLVVGLLVYDPERTYNISDIQKSAGAVWTEFKGGDPSVAFRLAKNEWKKGNSGAGLLLVQMYGAGYGTPADLFRAEYLLHSIKNDSIEGDILSMTSDQSLQRHWLEYAAVRGDLDALAILTGEKVFRDFVPAAKEREYWKAFRSEMLPIAMR